jgi:hypothetical protein
MLYDIKINSDSCATWISTWWSSSSSGERIVSFILLRVLEGELLHCFALETYYQSTTVFHLGTRDLDSGRLWLAF